MKKKLIFAGAAMLLTAAAVTGFSAYNKTDASDLLNANIEALARGEDPDCTYNSVKIDEDKHSITCKGAGHQCCRMN